MKLRIYIISIMIMLIIGGCNPSRKESAVVRVACFPNVTHAQALISKADGSSQKSLGNDIKLEWKIFNSGTSEIEAFLAGELDLGYIGPVPAINAFVKTNGDIQIISGAVSGGALVVARNDLNIKTLKDLQGKKIAVPSFGNTQDIMLRIMLANAGLKDTSNGGSIEIIPVKNPEVKTLFDQHQIDAAFVPEPWGSQLVKDANAKIVFDTYHTWRNGDYPTTVIIARKEFIQEHPKIVSAFLRNHVDLTEYYSIKTEELQNIINKEIKASTGSKLAEDVLKNSSHNIQLTYDPQRAALDELAKAMYEGKFIDEQVDIKGLLNMDILNSIVTANLNRPKADGIA